MINATIESRVKKAKTMPLDSLVFYVIIGFILFLIWKRSSNKRSRNHTLQTQPESQPEISDGILLPIDGVPDEVKTKLKQLLSSNSGSGIYDIERKSRNFLDDFNWPEFDVWIKRFMEMDYWPYMWGSLGEYIHLQNAPIDVLFEQLTKDRLLVLTAEYSVPFKKGRSKKQIIDSLSEAIPSQERIKVLEMVNNEWRPRYLREKRTLLIHTVVFRSDQTERMKRIKSSRSIIKNIEILPTDDCPICKEKSKVKLYPGSLSKEDLPPFHPGCRCVEIMNTK